MKKIATMLCLITVTSLTKADLIADWNFNGDSTGAAPNPSLADHGSGSLSFSGLANSGDASIISGGTAQNEYTGDSAGNALSVSAGGSGEPENGKSLIFSIDTSDYQNIVLTYATDASSTGFNSQQWSYSLNGTSYTSFGSAKVPGTTSFTQTGTETEDFSSVTALNDYGTVYFEATLTGASGTSGVDRFDNIQFNGTLSAVPEPATWGAISAVGLLGICGLREWRQRKQAQAA